MDQLRRDEFKQKLYELTPSDGKAISNPALRDLLQTAFPGEQFSLDDYWDLRNSLITDGKLEKGRGRGGSVSRVLTEAEPAAESVPSTAPAPEVGRVAEAALYEPFQKCIQEGYVPDNDIKPWIWSYYRKLWIRCGNERGGVPFRVDHAKPGGSRVEGDATNAEGSGKRGFKGSQLGFV